ncbi:MAG: protein kinase [Acidobacteriota bacterium]
MTSPATIGPYRIVRMIGRGGMGVVYLAEHLDTGEHVALKTVVAAAPGLLGSLRREIRALARLSHPGIVRIVADGTHEGLPWYAMELLEGDGLQQHVTRLLSDPGGVRETALTLRITGPSPSDHLTQEPPDGGYDDGEAMIRLSRAPERERNLDDEALASVLALVRRLCSPIGYLHGEGIVHRDLKPDNVLVRADGWPAIVDFGLTTRFAAAGSREAIDVGAGAAGTVEYMAPEQAKGELVDARADLYALGCILYDLVTGTPPFRGASPAAIVWKHLSEPPLPPSALVPGLPTELDALCLRLLAKDPRDRLGHAEDVARALAALGAGAIEDWGPPGRPYLYRPRLVGRGGELGALRATVEAASRGEGSLVLLSGESGSGKTRLLIEVAAIAGARQVRVLAGECDPPGSTAVTALAPLRGPLQALADQCREEGLEPTHRIFGPRGKLLALYEPAIASLPGLSVVPDPPELPPAEARVRLLDFLSATFDEASGDDGLLLILDDLQWADELTIAFLAHHARRPRRLSIVGALRREEPLAAVPALLGLGRSPGSSTVAVDGLDAGSVAEIVRDMLALPEASGSFLASLVGQAEGNPFFVAEYLRAALAEGILGRDGRGQWRIVAPGKGIELPNTLRGLVLRRLATLGGAVRRVVNGGAILGREMPAALLARVVGVPDDAVQDAARELVARQVFEETAPSVYRFLHDKIREAVYEEMGVAARRPLHRAAASALQADRLDGRQVDLGTLGQHWDRAGEHSRARACYLPAAHAALRRHAIEEGGRLLRAYLAIVDATSLESLRAGLELARGVYQLRGQYVEALDGYRAVLEQAHAVGARREEAQALHGIAHVKSATAPLDDAIAACAEADAAAEAIGDVDLRIRGRMDLSNAYRHAGRMDEVRRIQEESLALGRASGNRARQRRHRAHRGLDHLTEIRRPLSTVPRGHRAQARDGRSPRRGHLAREPRGAAARARCGRRGRGERPGGARDRHGGWQPGVRGLRPDEPRGRQHPPRPQRRGTGGASSGARHRPRRGRPAAPGEHPREPRGPRHRGRAAWTRPRRIFGRGSRSPAPAATVRSKP